MKITMAVIKIQTKHQLRGKKIIKREMMKGASGNPGILGEAAIPLTLYIFDRQNKGLYCFQGLLLELFAKHPLSLLIVFV